MTPPLLLQALGVLSMQRAHSAVTAYTVYVKTMCARLLSYPARQLYQVRAHPQNTHLINRNRKIDSDLNLLPFVGSVCSGNGACVYFDSSGNNLTSCSIFDYRCKASCACTNDFSGKDCTLSTVALVQRNGVRCVLHSLFPSFPLSLFSIFPIFYCQSLPHCSIDS